MRAQLRLLVMALALVAARSAAARADVPQTAWTVAMGNRGEATGRDFTCRVPARVGIAGRGLRVRLSNAEGGAPLVVTAAEVAWRTGGALGTRATLTFAGISSVTIAAGKEATSDPVSQPVAANQELTVGLYFAGNAPPATQLPYTSGTRCTSFNGGGDHLADKDDAAFTVARPHSWVTAIDVYVPALPAPANVLAIGDSITQDARSWAGRLATRLSARDPLRTVLNVGVSGNYLCDGNGASGSVTARLDRDLFSQAGVSHVVVFAGTNDLAFTNKTAPQLIDCFKKVMDRLHARGLKVIGGTMIPRVNFDAAKNQIRAELNAWIRNQASGLDGFIDFDQLWRDPAMPSKILAKYDSDGTHPNRAGHDWAGDNIDLALFGPAGGGAAPDAGPRDAAAPAQEAGPLDVGVMSDVLAAREAGAPIDRVSATTGPASEPSAPRPVARADAAPPIDGDEPPPPTGAHRSGGCSISPERAGPGALLLGLLLPFWRRRR